MRKDTQALRILMILENNSYPADTRVRQEAETLCQAGHRVSIICPRGAGQPSSEVINNVRVFRFPAAPGGHGVGGYMVEFAYATLITSFYVLWRWAVAGIDVIHLHNPPDTLFAAALLPKLAGVKVVYDQHDLSPELYLAKYQSNEGLTWRVLLRLEGLSFRLADQIITANESYRRQAATRHAIPLQKITAVRNGPDLKRMRLITPDKDIRARASTIIGYVGYISAQDGLDHLLHALHHLQYTLKHDDWYCVIVGTADNREDLDALTAQLRLTDRVCFTGYASGERLLAYLSAADIGVVPDPANPLNEKSTMIKVMEYMALSKPIVAYDLPEHRVSADEAALYAQPNDPLDFARQLARLIDTPRERAWRGALGRKRVETQLAWSYSAQTLVTLYQRFQDIPHESDTMEATMAFDTPPAPVEAEPFE